MGFLVLIAVLIVVALVGGWWLDRVNARRGVRVTGVRHTGLRREITYEKVDDDGQPLRPDADPGT